jgi:hypothetical protein
MVLANVTALSCGYVSASRRMQDVDAEAPSEGTQKLHLLRRCLTKSLSSIVHEMSKVLLVFN